MITTLHSSLDSLIPAPALAMAAGVTLWILVYFLMPHPIRTYVLAHELTHALWGSMMGAQVSKMKISKNGGSVTLSKSNLLITLAPYFFPLYTILIVTAYYILAIFINMEHYYLYWLGLVGFTWGFHFTFTISTLMQHQSDIQEYGHVLSYAVIYIFNILGIGLWIIMVSDASLEEFVKNLTAFTENIGIVLWQLISGSIGKYREIYNNLK